MFNKKKLLVLLSLFLLSLSFVGIAKATDPYGLFETAKTAGLETTDNLPIIIGNVIGTALSMVAVIFFAIMIYGGFVWMTAHGNEEDTKKALNAITAAIIGIIIVLASYAITNFVFKSIKTGDVGGGGGDAGTVVTDANKECNTAHAGWTCNTIDMCSNVTSSTGNPATDCLSAGTSNCITNKCGTDATKICCQAKDASTLPDIYCFNVKEGSCKKLSEVGADNCPNGVNFQQYTDSTEKSCYTQGLQDKSCKNNDYCKTSLTGFICNTISKTCQPGTELDSACQTSKDCEDAICKNGTCQKGVSCTTNSYAGSMMCTPLACGSGDLCSSNSQCESNHCVDGKCEEGSGYASCNGDNDCDSGNFCTTAGSTKCCIAKVNAGENCFGMNNACKGGVCIDKVGFDVCQ